MSQQSTIPYALEPLIQRKERGKVHAELSSLSHHLRQQSYHASSVDGSTGSANDSRQTD